jgi:hypothetical protein
MSTEAFQTCDAGRARVHRPSEAGTPDMTTGRAAADRAGARPCASSRAARSYYFSGCTLRNNSLPMMKFAGWVDKTVQAYYEMICQIDYEYLFDSSKFAKAFKFEPTSYAEGV